jgi:L-fucose mutarotase
VSLRPQRLCLESFPKLGNETLFILALVEMVMLMGLDPIPIPELLRYLRAMGHGDETVVVDGSFFTAPVAKRLDGVGLRRVLCAIVAPMPQDESEPDTVLGMDVIGSPEERVPMQAQFRCLLFFLYHKCRV